ncbi:MAG TPA: ABC transporter substrate-binding protein [Noviherbaspirillum sp.]|uniref:ABC transporter substrate-binding protein n=1 Tax=Noviherbaspirillum sp. TaxID=1926288 RepID=UPI002D67E8A2|nr:ABC transporter substrate-binding protein [Noviherbaspirillum sp.]HYD95862.1 ABC transporter substrate-binding protein [Noviherbaspirillum sp.]
MNCISLWCRCVAFLVVFIGLNVGGRSHAQEIVIGQVAPLSGVLASTGNEMVLGAKVYFASVNAEGGINGAKIRHVVRDDGYTVAETVRQTREMIENDRPVALIGFAGTGNIGELMKQKVLEEAGIALIGPYTGAPGLRGSDNRNIFHIRASYWDEAEAMVDQLVTLSIKRIGIMYQNDPFGESARDGVITALKRHKLEPVVMATYEKNSADTSDAARKIGAVNPEAVIMIGVNKAVASFSKEVRQISNVAQLFSISVVNPREIVRLIGPEYARGIGIAQVMPSPHSIGVPVVKEYQAAMKKYAPPEAEFTYTSLEEFIAAKVLVEGIRRAGKNPTPQKVLAALASMDYYNPGGLPLRYSASNRVGGKFVELTIINRYGQLVR